MEARQTRSKSFIASLKQLENGERAALRRQAGKTLDEATLSASICRALPSGLSPDELDVYWLAATLFAMYPEDGGQPLARVLATIGEKGGGVERRFKRLIESTPAQLPHRLRYLIRIVASHRVSLDWAGLIDDLLRWSMPRRPVQFRWASLFYKE
jgi:CRISPR type I-E-associated protein CasB/Cse2